ncbi:E3 SUMO-protein ligase NSE2 [Manis javanica]|nr:E3 SUMO-protein ligase NSE2 [Manis javanica]
MLKLCCENLRRIIKHVRLETAFFFISPVIDGLQADREADGTEGVDEDMIVTQSQTNFICPITQMEMKKPVKNKVCGHTYEEEAIVRMIESKHRRKKKTCCPKIGCSHTDGRPSAAYLLPQPSAESSAWQSGSTGCRAYFVWVALRKRLHPPRTLES